MPMNLTGFNPQQLVARGVFDSLEELDRVMCELDEALSQPQVSRVGWSRGMDFSDRSQESGVRSQSFNRARMGSGVDGSAGSNVSPFGTAAGSSMTAPPSRRGFFLVQRVPSRFIRS